MQLVFYVVDRNYDKYVGDGKKGRGIVFYFLTVLGPVPLTPYVGLLFEPRFPVQLENILI